MAEQHAPEAVLVLNAGSSSLKYQVVEPVTAEVRVRGHVERIGSAEAGIVHDAPEGRTSHRIDAADHDGALREMTRLLSLSGVTADDLAGVGHRVVHGGNLFAAPVLVDDAVLAAIDGLASLAPLHNPPAAAGIRSARASFPTVRQVAVFDTAFFSHLPPVAATYAVDRTLAAREGIRRYGMHGTSHAYVATLAARVLDRDLGDLDQIVLHLGNGASAAAIRGGRPVDTSMGLTPLEGLVMGTRAGDLDPGIVLHLLRHGAPDGGPMTVESLEDLLHHRCGLQGLSGFHDFRDLLSAVDRGDRAATAAYDVYCYRIRKYVGAYLAVLGGADVLTFTAGVGENEPRVRRDVVSGLDGLGVELDRDLNDFPGSTPRRISSHRSRVQVLVVPTNEELAIARQVADLLR